MPRLRSEYILGANNFVTDATTSHTLGAWAELVASVAHDCSGINISSTVTIGETGQNRSMIFELGFGGAGSEVMKTQHYVGGHDIGLFIHLPIHIPKGTRLSGRVQGNLVSDIFSPKVVLEYAGFGWGGYSAAEAIGLNLATSSPTAADLTDNAWEECVASAANSYRALSLHCGLTNNGSSAAVTRVDVGRGAAAAEQLLGSWSYRTSGAELTTAQTGPRFIETAIAAGTRLAIRKNATVDLMGHLIGWR